MSESLGQRVAAHFRAGGSWPMQRRLDIMPAEAAPACLTAFQGVSPRVMRRFQRKPGSHPRLFLFSPLHITRRGGEHCLTHILAAGVL